jgi:hypothetical protein
LAANRGITISNTRDNNAKIYQLLPLPKPIGVIGVQLVPTWPVAPSPRIPVSPRREDADAEPESKNCWQHCIVPVLQESTLSGMGVAMIGRTRAVAMKRVVLVNMVCGKE